ncbi:MAG: hypothetical protein WDO71_01440 [Bacteroidota bacterium]
MKMKDKRKPFFGIVGDHANVLSAKVLTDFSFAVYGFRNENKEQTCAAQRNTASTRLLYITS